MLLPARDRMRMNWEKRSDKDSGWECSCRDERRFESGESDENQLRDEEKRA